MTTSHRRWAAGRWAAGRWAAVGAVLAGATLAMASLAGCSGGAASSDSAMSYSGSGGAESVGSGDSASDAGGVAEGATAESAAASSAAAPQSAADSVGYDSAERPASAGAASAPQVSDRQIIRTADVTLRIEVEPESGEKSATPAALADAATRAAHAVRGLATLPDAYVAGSDGHGATITVTLRIPSGNYDGVMGRLASIGDVTDQSESTEDVTGEIVDVSSRIKTMQASVDRLRALMADTESMKDVIALESELSSRQADLESLQRRQASLSDQVALSTISVTVNAVTAPTEIVEPEPVERSAFVAGVSSGWHGLTAVGRAAAAVFGALLPFLPLIAVIVAGSWVAVRLVRRSRTTAAPAPEVEGDV